MYIMAYFLNPSHQSVCLYVYPHIAARQRIGKNVTAATNTNVRIEELLERRFLCGPCRIKGKYAIGIKRFKRYFVSKTRVEAGSNTSTVTLRVVGGDEKGKFLI
jgi:hypothetical protein